MKEGPEGIIILHIHTHELDSFQTIGSMPDNGISHRVNIGFPVPDLHGRISHPQTAPPNCKDLVQSKWIKFGRARG